MSNEQNIITVNVTANATDHKIGSIVRGYTKDQKFFLGIVEEVTIQGFVTTSFDGSIRFSEAEIAQVTTYSGNNVINRHNADQLKFSHAGNTVFIGLDSIAELSAYYGQLIQVAQNTDKIPVNVVNGFLVKCEGLSENEFLLATSSKTFKKVVWDNYTSVTVFQPK